MLPTGSARGNWRQAWGKYRNPRTRQQVRLGRQSATPGGLDGWVYRCDQLGDRGNLVAGPGWDAP